MNLSESFLSALDSLAANKLRSVLTMLGVIIGVAAVIALLSIGNGVSGSVSNEIQSLGTNLIAVWPHIEEDAVDYQLLSMGDVNALADPNNAPAIKLVAAQVDLQERVQFGRRSKSAPVLGVSANFFEVNNLIKLEAGGLFHESDMLLRSRVMVLGAEIAKHLFKDASPIGQQVRMGDTTYDVIGVLEKQGVTRAEHNAQVFVPITTAHGRLFTERTRSGDLAITAITLQAVDEGVTKTAVTQVTNILRDQHNITNGKPDDFRMLSQQDLLKSFQQITRTLQIFLGAIAGISLVVGGIGIMNIMLVSVTERTREIGIRKALGALRRDILSQFLIESLLLSLMGGIIGVLLGWGISTIAGQLNTEMQPIMKLDTVVMATSFAAGVGLVFGIYPAWRAASLRPIEALRYE
ncbi:MAG: ABC transporter permease [Chloroflexi bacterium]|nr:MAG: ABC transporter permease [Chloroflexota bacterium]